MGNIIQFPSKPGEPVRSVDVTVLIFESIERQRQMLVDSLEWPDPTFLIRVYCVIARSLLANDYTEAEAVAAGWASLAVARERGLDFIEMIGGLPGVARPLAT